MTSPTRGVTADVLADVRGTLQDQIRLGQRAQQLLDVLDSQPTASGNNSNGGSVATDSTGRHDPNALIRTAARG